LLSYSSFIVLLAGSLRLNAELTIEGVLCGCKLIIWEKLPHNCCTGEISVLIAKCAEFGLILHIARFFFESFFSQLCFLFVSLCNFSLCLLSSSPRQLFFADRLLLSRTSNAHSRPASAAPRTLWQAAMNWFADVPPEADDSPSIIELNVWRRHAICEGILIVFSPISAGLPLLFQELVKAQLCVSAITAVFLLVLVAHFQVAIEDQKILAEELFRSQQRALRRQVDESAPQRYAAQVLQRRAHYRTEMPEYGAGEDLNRYFGYQPPQGRHGRGVRQSPRSGFRRSE
jgi:hypothetical protein